MESILDERLPSISPYPHFISDLGLISQRLFKDTYLEKFTAKSTNSHDFQLLILNSSLSIYLKVEDDYNLE
jgi:hypothetical protein